MKTCRVCGIDKPSEEFYRSRDTLCKVCDKARVAKRQRENPERQRAAVARWRATTGADYNRKYREANREAILEYQQRPEVRAAGREDDRRYYENNRAAHYARMVEWRRNNRERKVAHEHKRRLAVQDLTTADVDYIAILHRDPCSFCGESAGTIDHIQPLSGGGSGGWENLTAACRRCNATKRTTTLLRFLNRKNQ